MIEALRHISLWFILAVQYLKIFLIFWSNKLAVHKGVLLQYDVCGKDCRCGDYPKGHIRAVHEGVAGTVLFVGGTLEERSTVKCI